jgi:hypothetical protein
MYKVFTTNQNTLVLKGVPVAISNWNFPIQTNWNLPYILLGNQLTNEALAYFDALMVMLLSLKAYSSDL